MNGARDNSDDLTTMHVRGARSGDSESLTWIVERFSPFLLAQAKFRLEALTRPEVEPEDIVQEAWSVVLPRFEELEERGGRITPVLLSFLGATILNKVNNLARRQLRRKHQVAQGTSEDERPLEQIPQDLVTAAFARVDRQEKHESVLSAIENLPAADRRVFVLRAIEQLGNKEAASLLDETENATALRYSRVLKLLREKLGPTILDEID